jgi:four helix bundle protein
MFVRMTSDSNDTALREWEAKQPDAITKDPLWTLNCYREALFLVDLVREDIGGTRKQDLLAAAKGQFITSTGSIAANSAEGYGRMTIGDRTKYLGYSLGSTREAMTWYRTIRSEVDPQKIEDRFARLARIRRMLIGLLTRLKEGGGRQFDRW